MCKIVQNPKETTYQRIRLLSILYTSLAKDRENPEFGIASHSVNPLSEVGAGLQGSFNLGGVHGLVLGQVLLQTCASDRARVAYASSRYLRQNKQWRTQVFDLREGSWHPKTFTNCAYILSAFFFHFIHFIPLQSFAFSHSKYLMPFLGTEDKWEQ